MTVEEFKAECEKRGYRSMTVGGRPFIVNPANGVDVPFNSDVHDDLVRFHGEKSGSDLLESLLKILEVGINQPLLAM